MKMVRIFCLDDGTSYWFHAGTAYEAMRKLQYTLDLRKGDRAAIHKTESGKHLYLEHDGKTYAARI